MSKLQKYLKNKEELSPSPTYLASPPTIGDRIKVMAYGILPSKKITPNTTPPPAFNLKPTPEYREKTNWDYFDIASARRELTLALRDIGKDRDYRTIGLPEIKKAYDSLKDIWTKNGFSFDESGKFRDGIQQIFEKRAKVCLERIIDRAIVEANDGELSRQMYSVAVNSIRFWSRFGVKSDKTPKDILSAYLSSSNKLPVNSLPTDVHLAHMLSDSEDTSLNNNPHLTRDQKEEGSKYFGDNAIKVRPSVSCVAFRENEPPVKRFLRPIGILIKEGTIADASQSDLGSQPVSTDVRLSLFSRFGPIEERVRKALEYTDGTHREFVVGPDWEPKAIFYENWAAIKHKRIAKELSDAHSLPLYEFKQGTGFKEVNKS